MHRQSEYSGTQSAADILLSLHSGPQALRVDDQKIDEGASLSGHAATGHDKNFHPCDADHVSCA